MSNGTILWFSQHIPQEPSDTWKRRLGVRTYKVVPFTPSAGVLEWVNGTLPLGEYLIGSMRNGGAHGRYGMGDWSFLKCREHMANERDKRKAFQEVCNNSGLLCITFSWRDFYSQLSGLKRDLRILEVCC
ncbi:serine/threonine-protein kinase ATM-like [Phaseolus vulgaris]|uniref:serine/threonine-protein kinase ATM-like n=1 Tax=Phaseolus vulgaris TaxID=3885 RepID=UPI0035CB8BC8